jgi:hypothetical protein
MINAQLNLIIPIFIHSKNRYEILSLVDYALHFPHTEIGQDQDINETIIMLLSRYLKDTSGINPKLTDIISTSKLDIYYMCFINYETTIMHSFTREIDVTTDTLPPNATKTISLLAK